MVGYPNTLNSREDYEYVKNHFPKSMWEQDFKNLLNTKEWFNQGEIVSTGKSDSTHKVVTDDQTGKRYQYELVDDPNSKIYQLGYTVEEVERIISEG